METVQWKINFGQGPYKTELRLTLRNYFTDFADAFNHLIEAAEEAVREAGMGRRILFVIDGTDLLRDEDARAFFIADVHQLQQMRGLFIYCAPIHLVYEGTTIEQSFDRIFNLPMIKVANADGSRNEICFSAMREMLYRRAAPDLFDGGVADDLIEQSGGHPRDFLRLLRSAFMFAERVTTLTRIRQHDRRGRFGWPPRGCILDRPWSGGSLRYGSRLRRIDGCGSIRRPSA